MIFDVGCDIGTVTAKAAVLSTVELQGDFFSLYKTPETWGGGKFIYLTPLFRIQGGPMDAALSLLSSIRANLPGGAETRIAFTGSSSGAAADRLTYPKVSEFRALAASVSALHHGVEGIIEMGGENSRYILIEQNGSGPAGITGYGANGDCAAGTGSFMDQQATRLGFTVEEAGLKASLAARGAKIAGRCSVFAKSDMIHAQQKGFSPDQVLKGLCDAVARSYKSGPASEAKPGAKMIFLGGVARNKGVVNSLRAAFETGEEGLFAPGSPEFYGAIGAALIVGGPAKQKNGSSAEVEKTTGHWQKLDLSGVSILSNGDGSGPASSIETGYLGIDVGSVSTNLVLTDSDGILVDELYLRTRARPVEVVTEGLAMLLMRNGPVRILGVATTGSGRELIGELVGADAVHDEITAHKTGAFHVAESHIGEKVDTIFEIGGQDSKFISIKDGIVVDFAMNEACAAGTGSFLEEQAEKLGISIVDEFSEIAFSSETPLRMGERCTVYMETDVTQRLREGEKKEDVIAGLAYSVVQNYLNRVARGRPVGDVIFFQGGTAYNRSVAAAFSKVLGKRIIVPPHNGVMGAYGAALLARDRMSALGRPSTFRGYDLGLVRYTVNEFTCHTCDNSCDVQVFDVEGKKTYWGDKCSEKYRREAKTDNLPAGPDLMALRNEALLENYFAAFLAEGNETALRVKARKTGQALKIAFPRSMYFYDRFPFWNTYLKALGAMVTVSGPTTRKTADAGIGASVAEPCFPIQAAHGHFAECLDTGAEHVFLPSVINSPTPEPHTASHACPWGQTMPYVLKASPLADGREPGILAPVVHFREGPEFVEKELWNQTGRRITDRAHHKDAVKLAFLAMERFEKRLGDAGREMLALLEETGKSAIVLFGRPYNVNDPGLNLNVPAKIRKLYGIDVIPLDFLPLDDVAVKDIHPNMYWNYGRKILAAARYTAANERLHPVYLTNFKCGPDSFIKTFAAETTGKPYLTLQFDAHGNDAGMLTRVEAFLDSKGFLRWWKKGVERPSTNEHSTSPECVKVPPGSSRRPSVQTA